MPIDIVATQMKYKDPSSGNYINVANVAASYMNNIETVSGATVSITGEPNMRYVCGEVSTISITPPASGSMSVRFESGSTAAVLTAPSSGASAVHWPEWFDATSLEANTIYEIMIEDGVYGMVMSWPT